MAGRCSWTADSGGASGGLQRAERSASRFSSSPALSLSLGSRAEVTGNISRLSLLLPLSSLSELSNHLIDEGVDLELRSYRKSLFAEGARPPDIHVPLLSDAALAEVVSTRGGDGKSEDVQTDGAEQLIFSQQAAGRGHICRQEHSKVNLSQTPFLFHIHNQDRGSQWWLRPLKVTFIPANTAKL